MKKTFLWYLIQVRGLIYSGRESYICHALNHLGAPDKYRMRVLRQLQGVAAYEVWVWRRYPEVYDRMRLSKTAFREGRLAWIDDMIKQEQGK